MNSGIIPQREGPWTASSRRRAVDEYPEINVESSSKFRETRAAPRATQRGWLGQMRMGGNAPEGRLSAREGTNPEREDTCGQCCRMHSAASA